MKSKKLSSSLIKLIDDLAEISHHDFSWSEFDNKISTIGSSAKEKDVERLLTEEAVYEKAFFTGKTKGWNRGTWIANRVTENLVKLNVSLGDKLLRNSEIDAVKVYAISNGIYTDVSIIDEVAKKGSGDSQVVAASFCSIKTLRTLKGHKSTKIRKVYYNRLGPVECLDEMLSDKIADIRYEGIARAPYFYDKLSSLVKEIARGPFSLLVEKIPIDYLPMLVANRNVKNSWISSKFERRITSGK